MVENSSGKKIKVVTVKNYPMRNRVMGFFSLPLLLLVSTFILIPIMAFNLVNVGTAVIATVVSEIIAIIIALKYTNSLSSWREKLRLQNFSWKSTILGVTIGFCLMIVLQLLAWGLGHVGLGVESSDTSTSLGELHGISKYIVLFLFVPLVVPAVEEIFFRGYTLGFVVDSFEDKRKGFIWGTIASVVSFAIAHFQGFNNFTDFFLLGWIGCIALIHCLLVRKTNSVFPAMFSHMTYNGLTVLVTVLANS